MGFLKRMFAAAAGAGLLLGFAAAPVKADTIAVDLISITPTGTGTFLWTYEATVSNFSRTQSGSAPNADVVSTSDTTVGDWFTIYDFVGYVPGTEFTTNPDFDFLSRNVGPTADTRVNDIVPPDHGGIPNLTWYYEQGPDILGVVGGTLLGQFGAESQFGSSVLGAYSARDFNEAGAGGKASNVGQVAVPIPLPMAAWAGLALFGLMAGNRVRKSRI